MPFIIQSDIVSLPTDPFPHADTYFVSEREVTEALGGSVMVAEDSNTVSAIIGPWTAAAIAGDRSVTVDGNGQSVTVDLQSAPYVDGGEMFVPFEFFSEAFGYDVTMSDGTLTIVNPNAL